MTIKIWYEYALRELLCLKKNLILYIVLESWSLSSLSCLHCFWNLVISLFCFKFKWTFMLFQRSPHDFESASLLFLISTESIRKRHHNAFICVYKDNKLKSSNSVEDHHQGSWTLTWVGIRIPWMAILPLPLTSYILDILVSTIFLIVIKSRFVPHNQMCLLKRNHIIVRQERHVGNSCPV